MADIALAASARDWPDRLHRFILDHGGGRIVDRVMGPDQAVASKCDALLIDDVCSFLTPRLVATLKAKQVEVIGVYAPEDASDAKRRLLECGITDVIETDAGPEEFLSKVRETLAHSVVTTPHETGPRSQLNIGVTGPVAGVGITEVALSVAWGISMTISTALVDLDQTWPSLAQRLGLPVHPNIRTALDHALHDAARITTSAFEMDSGLLVVGGLADGGAGSRLSRHDALSVLDALGHAAEVVVADLGPAADVERGLIRELDSLLVVGRGDPVGMSRLIKTASEVQRDNPSHSVLVVVNAVDRSGFRRSEALAELDRALPDIPAITLPFDPHLARVAWDGELGFGSKFRKSVESMSRVVVGSLG